MTQRVEINVQTGEATVTELTAEELALTEALAAAAWADRALVLVKAEAMRRILAICPEWKQHNLTARAVLLAKKVADGGTLTNSEQAEWDAGEAVWDQIAAIRAASDALEAMDPIPQEYTDDNHWP